MITIFQSTHPVRGATLLEHEKVQDLADFNPRTPCGVRPIRRELPNDIQHHFNPRTPCGVRPVCTDSTDHISGISIHAPRAGCDYSDKELDYIPRISIHAPRAGCDGLARGIPGDERNFNPRTPCGVRRTVGHGWIERKDFNPRTPCGVRLTVMEI